MQSNNPVFGRSQAFNGRPAADVATPTAEELRDMYAGPSAGPVQTGRMTYDDVVAKTGLTLAVLLVGAVVGWMYPGLMLVGLVVGLVLGLVNSFKREPSPALILAYAAFEGLFVGGISNVFENMRAGFNAAGDPVYLDGIVAQAILGTVAVFAVALVVYRQRWIRVTSRFRKVVIVAGLGYLLFSLVNLVAMLFDWVDGPFGFRNGMLGVGISVFAVVLASLFLMLDFDFIEKGVATGLPAKYAWTAAFGLVVTLVWLYVEMLRLIAILRGD
jgi:uncharacterized YccA/Bax inhibitor family protein